MYDPVQQLTLSCFTGQVYTIYSILSIVFVILLVVTAFITVAVTPPRSRTRFFVHVFLRPCNSLTPLSMR